MGETTAGAFHHAIPEPRSNVLLRERLLPPSLAEMPALTVIDGGSGTGRSVLSMQYARFVRDQGGIALYIRMRPNEAGTYDLYTRARLALESNRLIERGVLPTEHLPGIHELAETRLRQIPEPLVIIFDDCRLISEEELRAARAALNSLESLPEMRLVMSGRGLTEFTDDEVRLRSCPRFIDEAELALTLEETRDIIGLYVEHVPMRQRAKWAKRLLEQTQGWLAAVSAAMLSAVEHWAEAERIPGEIFPGRELFAQRFVEKHLSGVEGEDLELLLVASFFPNLSEAAADWVCGSAANRLGALSEKLLQRYRDDAGVLHYLANEVIREELQAAAATRLGRERRTSLFRRCASELRDRDPERAIEAAVEAEEWDLMLELMHRHEAEHLWSPDGVLGRVIQRVPSEVRGRYPILKATQLVIERLQPGAVPRTRMRQARKAISELYLESLKPGAAGLRASVLRMWIARATGDAQFSLETAEQILKLIEEEDSSGADRMLRLAGNQIVITLSQLGLHDRAEELAAGPLSRSAVWDATRVHTESLRMLNAVVRGDLPLADTLLRAFEAADLPRRHRGGYEVAGYLLAKTVLHLERGQNVAAADTLRSVRRVGGAAEHEAMIAWAQVHLVEAVLGREEALAKLRRYADARAHGDPMLPMHRSLISELEARLRFHTRTSQEGLPGLGGVYHALSTGAYEHALMLAAEHAQASVETGCPRRTVEALLLQAEACNLLGDASREQLLERVRTLIREYRLRLPLRALPWYRDRILGEAALPSVPEPPLPEPTRLRAMRALSRAELRTLRQVAESGNAVRAAQKLNLSPHTVRDQLKAAYRKLGVSSRSEAIQLASAMGIIPDRRSAARVAARGSIRAGEPSLQPEF